MNPSPTFRFDGKYELKDERRVFPQRSPSNPSQHRWERCHGDTVNENVWAGMVGDGLRQQDLCRGISAKQRCGKPWGKEVGSSVSNGMWCGNFDEDEVNKRKTFDVLVRREAQIIRATCLRTGGRIQRDRADANREEHKDAFLAAIAAFKRGIEQSKTNCYHMLYREADANSWENT